MIVEEFARIVVEHPSIWFKVSEIYSASAANLTLPSPGDYSETIEFLVETVPGKEKGREAPLQEMEGAARYSADVPVSSYSWSTSRISRRFSK